MQLEPENIDAQKNLADFYYAELGQADEALKIYENGKLVDEGYSPFTAEKYSLNLPSDVNKSKTDVGNGVKKRRRSWGKERVRLSCIKQERQFSESNNKGYMRTHNSGLQDEK